MKESVYQAKILLALRTHPILKDAVIWKFTDRFNGGIPDFCVIWQGHTTWWEVKVAPRKLTKLQEHYIKKIGIAAHVITRVRSDNYIGGAGKFFGTCEIDELVSEIVRRCVNV